MTSPIEPSAPQPEPATGSHPSCGTLKKSMYGRRSIVVGCSAAAVPSAQTPATGGGVAGVAASTIGALVATITTPTADTRASLAWRVFILRW